MTYRYAVRLLFGEFDRCSKHNLKQRRDETAKFSEGLVARFIIGIYYWNGTQPLETTFAESLRLPRSHNQDECVVFVSD